MTHHLVFENNSIIFPCLLRIFHLIPPFCMKQMLWCPRRTANYLTTMTLHLVFELQIRFTRFTKKVFKTPRTSKDDERINKHPCIHSDSSTGSIIWSLCSCQQPPEQPEKDPRASRYAKELGAREKAFQSWMHPHAKSNIVSWTFNVRNGPGMSSPRINPPISSHQYAYMVEWQVC